MSTISLGRSGIVGISYSETSLLKSNLMRANERINSASNNVNSAKVKLQVNGKSGRIRVESDNLQSYYRSLKSNNSKIEKIIRDIDYIVRRFKEVDSRCASRIRAINRGYKVQSSISKIENSLITLGNKAFTRASNFLKEGKAILQSITKPVKNFFGTMYKSVTGWFHRHPVVGSAISFGLNVLAVVGSVVTIAAGGPIIAIVGAAVGGVLALNGLIDDGTRIYNNVVKGKNKGFNAIETGLKAVAGEKIGGTVYGVLNVVDFSSNIPNMVKGIAKVGSSLVDSGKSIGKVIKKVPEIVSDFKGSIKNIPDKIKDFKNISTTFIKDIGDGIKSKNTVNLKFATTGIDIDDIGDLSKIDDIDIPPLNDIQKNFNKIVYEGDTIKGVRDSNKILIKGDVVDKELLLQKPKDSPNPKRWLNNGGSISIDNDGVWTYIHPDGHSVKYTDGFPDFKSAGLVKQEVDIGEFNNYYDDFNKADELAPNGPRDATNNTWHHHQDGKTMQEVNKEIHKDYTHRGGMSIKKKK